MKSLARDGKSATAPSVHALLGPTNTGKTHRAIERMLEFQTGAIGLPLRLLAREVYDRVSERVGERAVALVTGEEKRVPARARYFVCTVEAMPPDLEVEFLAVDEIQLVANPERGHVFTDRLLRWRGSRETWFLCSPAHVTTVWDVCRIPNYEKRMPEHQAERLLPLLEQLVRTGRLVPDYVDAQVKRLERSDGDIHVLLDRLAAVRTWTYVSHQSGWLDDAVTWRERTRALEDRLSDALHERLLARFVRAPGERIPSEQRSLRPGERHPFAKLAELDVYRDPDRESERAREAWLERVIAADFAAWELAPSGDVSFRGREAREAHGRAIAAAAGAETRASGLAAAWRALTARAPPSRPRQGSRRACTRAAGSDR